MATKIYKRDNYILIDDGLRMKEIPAKDCTYDVIGSDYTIIDTIKGFETVALAFSNICDEFGNPYASESTFVSFLRKSTGSDSTGSAGSNSISNFPLTAFGDLRTAELHPIFQYSFEYTVTNTQLTTNIVTNGGTVTHADAMAVV